MRTQRIILSSLLLAGMAFSPAFASDQSDVQNLQKSIQKQEALIKSQQKALSDQLQKLAEQEKEIADHRAKLEELMRKVDTVATDQQVAMQSLPKSTKAELKASVGAGKPSTTEASAEAPVTAAPIVAPPKEEKRPEISALADQGGVLTPKGTLMYENSLEYVNTTNNVFTFSGVQVAEVVFIGVTNATTSKRQVVQDSNRLRLGLTNRLETDIRVPFVYRNDKISETNTSTGVTTRTAIEAHDLGDIDGGFAYQINDGKAGWPFLVANARYKLANADGPFDVPYDVNNLASRLPTGTGYYSVEGSMTAIKVTDPAVLFGNLGYVHNFDTTVDRTVGNTKILEFSPGDAINASAGLGFSINPETSFTLGYKHSYVLPSTQYNQNVTTGARVSTESDDASIGALLVGASYRFNPITSLNFNVEVGTTSEAPDVRVGIRIPVRLGTLF